MTDQENPGRPWELERGREEDMQTLRHHGARLLAALALVPALAAWRHDNGLSALAVGWPVYAWFAAYSAFFIWLRRWRPGYAVVTDPMLAVADLLFLALVTALSGGWRGQVWPVFIPVAMFYVLESGLARVIILALAAGLLYWWGGHMLASGFADPGPLDAALWRAAIIAFSALAAGLVSLSRRRSVAGLERRLAFMEKTVEALERGHEDLERDRDAMASQAERHLGEVKRKEFMFHLVKELNERQSVDEILIHTLNFLPESLNDCEIMVVIFVEDECLVYHRELEGGSVDIRAEPLYKSGNAVKLLAEVRRPEDIDKPGAGYQQVIEWAREHEIRSIWVEPMVSRQRIVGHFVIMKTRKRELTPREKNEVRYLVYQSATALENMILTVRLEKLAATDGLTGLFNHRVFQESLDRELHRAARYGFKVGLFLFDIDYFKKINDAYGHQAGDEALVELGRRLMEGIRAEDIPARYGGEEFTVILPETDLDGAAIIAERIRRQFIGERLFECESVGESIKVTISGGLAIYPDHGLTPQELIAAADEALYRAKESGRNRVMVFGELDPIFEDEP